MMPPLHLLLRLACTAAIASAGARPARADCGVTLEGDPEVLAAIRIELAGFPDQPGDECVAVEVTCRAVDGRVALALRDELGRSQLRVFASPAGAAAFVISWSRRPRVPLGPLGPLEAGHERALPEAKVVGDLRPETDRGGWRPEVEFGLVLVPRQYMDMKRFIVLQPSLIRRRGPWRYGVSLRALSNRESSDYWYLAVEALGTVGVERSWRHAIYARGELTAGPAVLGATVSGPPLEYVGAGVVAGGRAVLGARFGPFAFELGAGFHAIEPVGPVGSADPFGENTSFTHTHLDAGIRWVP